MWAPSRLAVSKPHLFMLTHPSLSTLIIQQLSKVTFYPYPCQSVSSVSLGCQTEDNKQCVFPFTYNNVVFYGCTSTSSANFHYPKTWCATSTNDQGNYVTWAYCNDDCPKYDGNLQDSGSCDRPCEGRIGKHNDSISDLDSLLFL